MKILSMDATKVASQILADPGLFVSFQDSIEKVMNDVYNADKDSAVKRKVTIEFQFCIPRGATALTGECSIKEQMAPATVRIGDPYGQTDLVKMARNSVDEETGEVEEEA